MLICVHPFTFLYVDLFFRFPEKSLILGLLQTYTVLCKSNESVSRRKSRISGLFGEKWRSFVHLKSSKKIQRIFPLPIVLADANFQVSTDNLARFFERKFILLKFSFEISRENSLCLTVKVCRQVPVER